MKFRKKTIVIEAEQWFPGKQIKGVMVRNDHLIAHIKTLEGLMTVTSGDWIITGVNGEVYPCKPDIFEKTYEPVSPNG